MKANFSEKKRRLLRRVYGFLSFSTGLFVFQACYGVPSTEVPTFDVNIQGIVKSKFDDKPISGIKVSTQFQIKDGITDSNGYYQISSERANEVFKVKFEDIDSTKNGVYASKDTVIYGLPASKTINIDVFLDEK